MNKLLTINYQIGECGVWFFEIVGIWKNDVFFVYVKYV